MSWWRSSWWTSSWYWLCCAIAQSGVAGMQWKTVMMQSEMETDYSAERLAAVHFHHLRSALPLALFASVLAAYMWLRAFFAVRKEER